MPCKSARSTYFKLGIFYETRINCHGQWQRREIETITLVDVLRRAKCHVTLASVEATLLIKASRGVSIQADCFISDCRDENFDLIALPGGMPGASRLADCPALIELLDRQRQRRGAASRYLRGPGGNSWPLGLAKRQNRDEFSGVLAGIN